MDEAGGARDLVVGVPAAGSADVGDRRLRAGRTLARRVRENLRAARLDRAEAAGSLGDMGTFLPLLVGMAAGCGLDFATALFFAGAFGVVTGLMFPVPMAVQPMKAIAAVALTQGLTADQIVAAGAVVSAVVLALGASGGIGVVDRLAPRSVVRGMQLGLGVMLVVKGAGMVAGTGAAVGADSYVTGAVALVVVLALLRSRRWPAALVLCGAGVAIAAWTAPGAVSGLEVGVWLPRWSPPSWGDVRAALVPAALPQVPLTTLNSVIAVALLASELFPERRVEAGSVARSVGVMNLVGVWFGAMPMCHGAGGLAGQYRFGARTNGSILLLGTAKMALAVALGASLMPLLAAFPASVLGVMLGVVGVELGMAARREGTRGGLVVVVTTAGACVAFGNVALGVVIGIVASWVVRVVEARGRWSG